MKLVIGNKNYSSWSLRPWLVLKQLEINFEEIIIPLYEENSTQEILKYSPSGKVPLLIDGDLKVWDSLAICEYLNEKFPQAQLWPQNEKARAYARSVSAEMHSGFQNLRQNLGMNLRKENVKKEFSSEVQKDIQRIQEIWSSCLKEFCKEGKFLFGNFSIADAMFAPVVFRFRSYGVWSACESRIQTYMKNIYDLPALGQWRTDAAKESWVIAKFE